MSSHHSHAGRLARAVLLSAIVGTFVVGTALAAKPPGSTSSNFRVSDAPFASQALASGGTGTWVHARCYQNGTLVYEQYVKYDANHSGSLTLGPTPMWSSGAASCKAEDGWWQNGSRWRVNATVAFSAT